MITKAELVLDAKCDLGEGPGWDADTKLLYWVDINSKKIHGYSPETEETHIISLDQQVGAAVLRNLAG